MTIDELSKEIALGMINTGVEGGYESVSCSTAGDYPSMGCQQVEGLNGRGDELLNMIPGGEHYAGRAYSDIESAGELDSLSELLDSPAGHEAQLKILQRDTARYAQIVIDAGLTDARCVIYAGMWCPTSEIVVSEFIQHRVERGYDIQANLAGLSRVFHNQYALAAAVGDEYWEGYQNRADNTFDYVSSLDLSAYGYGPYEA